jgi:membrane-associated progesterone receptor component
MPQALALARRFVDDIVSSPLNICLVGLIVYFSYKLIRRDSSSTTNAKSNKKEKRQLEPMPKQDFTLEQLRNYDGVKSDGRILIAVLGRVFDVSRSAEFYGPGGPYSVFAGRDASRALATFSVDANLFKETYDDLSDLKASQMDSVKEWEMQFLEKYPVIGKLLKEDEEPTNYQEQEQNNVANNENNESHSKKEL